MKKKNYLIHLTPEILANKELLNEWCKNCDELELFGLSAEILYNDKLFFEWFEKFKNFEEFFATKDRFLIQDFLTNIKSNYPDIDNYKIDIGFINEISEIMSNILPTLDLMDKEKINSGKSIEEINSEKNLLINNVAKNLTAEFENYSFNEKLEYYKNIIPILIEDFNQKKEEFYINKTKDLFKFESEQDAFYNSITNDTLLNYNRNYWNQNCFNLFNYLVDNYEKKGKIKFVNIYYFLKNHVDKKKYAFSFTIDNYKIFISNNYNINITTFRKAEYEFLEKEVPILISFEQDFRMNN